MFKYLASLLFGEKEVFCENCGNYFTTPANEGKCYGIEKIVINKNEERKIEEYVPLGIIKDLNKDNQCLYYKKREPIINHPCSWG